MYLEADVLYAYLKPADWLKAVAERILGKDDKFITSAATVIEIEIVSLRDFSSDFSLSVLSKLKSIKNLEMLPITTDNLDKAVEVRRSYGLSIFDSIHASVCLINGEKLVSTDPVFDKVTGLERIDPRNVNGDYKTNESEGSG